MHQSSFDILEYAALKQLVGRFVSTSMGRAELDKLTPSADRNWLDRTLAETAEALAYLEAAASPTSTPTRGAVVRPVFQDLPDAGASLARIAIEGASLDGKEILAGPQPHRRTHLVRQL